MAMTEVPDRGNPNFFTLFNGSHVAQLAGSSSTSNVFMLTSMNTVQFLGDCTAGADGRMWVLPEECRPKNPVRFMCPIEPTGDVPGASYEVVVDVTAESKAVEVVTGIATGTSKALTEATLATETANAAAGVELATETANAVAGVELATETANAVATATLSTETANAVAGVKLTTKSVPNLVSSPSAMTGDGLTAGQYDGLVGTPALSSATMTKTTAKVLSKGSLQTTTAKVLSKASLQTTTAEVLSKASLQAQEGDFLVSATAVSGSMEVAGMPNVKKSVIKVPDTPGSTFAVVTVMPDGTISGEPGVLHYTNGHMFSISDNWYLEG